MGLVETDWLPFPFAMNWRFTDHCACFEQGEPFCFFTLVEDKKLEDIDVVFRSLDGNPDLKAQYDASNT